MLGSAYRIHFWYMSKGDAIKIINNFNFIDKMVFCNAFYLYIKMSNTTYHQRNRDVILNRAKYYFENNRERLREQARNKYRNLSEEDKNKKSEYGKNRYHKLSEDKKEKLKEYEKKNHKAKKSKYNNVSNSFLIVCAVI